MEDIYSILERKYAKCCCSLSREARQIVEKYFADPLSILYYEKKHPFAFYGYTSDQSVRAELSILAKQFGPIARKAIKYYSDKQKKNSETNEINKIQDNKADKSTQEKKKPKRKDPFGILLGDNFDDGGYSPHIHPSSGRGNDIIDCFSPKFYFNDDRSGLFIIDGINPIRNLPISPGIFTSTEPYQKSDQSLYVLRQSHNYKWYGSLKDVKSSLEENGVVAKCISLDLLDYNCIVYDYYSEDEDSYLMFRISESEIEEKFFHMKGLYSFMVETGLVLCDFRDMDIIAKLEFLIEHFDLLDLLALYKYKELSYYEALCIIEESNLRPVEYQWSEYSFEEQEDILRSKLYASDNPDSYLSFLDYSLRYVPSKGNIWIKYLIYSEYSIVVYTDILVYYKDGTIEVFDNNIVPVKRGHLDYFETETLIHPIKRGFVEISKIVLYAKIEED